MKDSVSVPEAAVLLRAAGFRATPQRLALVAALRAKKRPIAVEDLLKEGKGKFDMTTAYRTLEALTSRGLVRRIGLDHNRALFEMADDHHHHAVCTSCGLIRDVSACVPVSLKKNVRAATGFESIDSHTLDFFGTCSSCARKAAR